MLKDAHNQLRPLGFVDLLDETIELYKNNFVLMVGIAAFLYVPYTLLTMSLQNPRLELENAYFFDFMSTIAMVLIIIVIAFYVVAAPIVTGALTYGVSERYLGRETSIADCYRRVLRASVFLPLILANILVLLALIGSFVLPALFFAASVYLGGNTKPAIIGLTFVLLFIPSLAISVYIWGRLLLVAPALVIEMRGIKGSLARSWQLMNGNVLKALGLLLIAVIVVAIVHSIIGAPISITLGLGQIRGSEAPQSLVVINAILQTILNTIFAPITSIIVVLLYYDQRIRKEGFDLELLAQELAASSEHSFAYGVSALPQERLSDSSEIGTQSVEENKQ